MLSPQRRKDKAGKDAQKILAIDVEQSNSTTLKFLGGKPKSWMDRTPLVGEIAKPLKPAAPAYLPPHSKKTSELVLGSRASTNSSGLVEDTNREYSAGPSSGNAEQGGLPTQRRGTQNDEGVPSERLFPATSEAPPVSMLPEPIQRVNETTDLAASPQNPVGDPVNFQITSEEQRQSRSQVLDSNQGRRQASLDGSEARRRPQPSMEDHMLRDSVISSPSHKRRGRPPGSSNLPKRAQELAVEPRKKIQSQPGPTTTDPAQLSPNIWRGEIRRDGAAPVTRRIDMQQLTNVSKSMSYLDRFGRCFGSKINDRAARLFLPRAPLISHGLWLCFPFTADC